MKNLAVYILIPLVFVLIGWFGNTAYHLPKDANPIAEIKPRPLEKYSIEALAGAYPDVLPTQIAIGQELKKSAQAVNPGKFTSHEFTFSFDPTLTGKSQKTVSGLINIPGGKGPFPLIIMIRGYVDQEQYFIGEGTQKAGEFFAQNGYITIAPDFLGYGDSDSESANIFESRFQTYTTMMELTKSIGSLGQWDNKNAFIWAHSNGGQIALNLLEITGLEYPTALWAPNSAKFPYSIIYYLDEASDEGKLIITKLAEFMADYDVRKYSFTNYLDRIKAPVQLNQGTADSNVPVSWSDNLVKNLKKNDIEIEYIKYPGADHNLQPAWNSAVANNLRFFHEKGKSF